MPAARSRPELVGRRDECERLDRLLETVKAGRSGVVVLRGDAGVGKSALLRFLVERADGCRVLRAQGVASETGLAYAGLHQLCSAHLDRLDRLPGPQRDALMTAFGVRSGAPPDRLLVGLAVLSLLREIAAQQPLVCVVDDAQRMDRSSAQALAFAARRLGGEPVVMVFAVRRSDDQDALAGLPELVVRGLCVADAAVLLQRALAGTLDLRVRERILAESRGNPLALLELTRGASAAELALGAVPAPRDPPRMRPLEQAFLRQAATLPVQSRRLLLVAAAEPVGDVPLLWRAAERLGLGPDAATAAEACGLIEFRDRVRFRHPLVRSAVYRAALPAERRMVHEALARVTDAEADPDRRAWHRARAAVEPDEAVASELERSRNRALAHGDLDAAATFLEEAAALTPDPGERVRRSLDGAQARLEVGAFDEAQALVSATRTGPLDQASRARADLIQARISCSELRSDQALPLLLAAARRLEPLEPLLARDAYLDALSTAILAGHFATRGVVLAVADAALWASREATRDATDALLQGVAVLLTQGQAAAAPALRAAVRMFVQERSTRPRLQGSWLAASMARSLWDDAGWELLTQRHLDGARTTGARSALPQALDARALVHLLTGDLPAAARLIDQVHALAGTSTGTRRRATSAQVCRAAMIGEDAPGPLILGDLDELYAWGEGAGVSVALWGRAMLCNALGRYGEAVEAAREAAAEPSFGASAWALAELVEAAHGSGNTTLAANAMERLSAVTQAAGSQWALGVEASRRALLSAGDAADTLHREAIERLGSTSMGVDLARATLLYGEWLQREGRGVHARNLLRAAYESLAGMGVATFADRARRELLAGGEPIRNRPAAATQELTAQEAHIARLAIEGLSNAEIGGELYISARTVEWHLRRIFIKLGVTGRRQLRLALPGTGPAGTAGT